MAALDESACIYAALILADDGVSITAEKLNTILKAANVTHVEPFWPVLFAKALSSVNVKDLIAGLSSGGLAAPAAAPAAAAPTKGGAPAAAPAPKKEEKKKEPEPEEEEDMSLSLFD